MHRIIIEELESHLAGRDSVPLREHLSQCGDCRREVLEMDEVSGLLRTLRSPEGAGEPFTPAGGFYAGVATRVMAKQQSSAWGMFAPGAQFFRRVAFASLLLLAGLGSWLITNEPEFSVNDATAIIARHAATGSIDGAADAAGSRDQILLTLVNWSE